jgi:hypothetical protein
MVKNPGKTLCVITCKPINLPESLQVEESASGEPAAVRMPQRLAVTSIEDRWRIDEEWWRSEPISRLYYAILFKSGQRLVIFQDLDNGMWYKQGY